jgi:hypothetical protein
MAIMKISKSDLKKLIENVVREQSNNIPPAAYRRRRNKHPMDPDHIDLDREGLLPNQSEIETKLVENIVEDIGETLAEMGIPLQMGPSRDPKFIAGLTTLISAWLNENIDFEELDSNRLSRMEPEWDKYRD